MPEAAVRWIQHILHLDSLAASGCVFGIDDLTADEWGGRALLEQARAEFRRNYTSCERCGRAIPRWSRQGCRCGG